MIRKDWRCSKKQWCPAMAERLSDQSRGFNMVRVLNVKAAKTQVIGIAYRMSAKDRGIMLNVCPWCAADIAFFTPAEKREKSEERS